MLGLQVIGLYAWRVGIPFVEETQLTTGFGVLTIRPRFILRLKDPQFTLRVIVAVIRSHGR